MNAIQDALNRLQKMKAMTPVIAKEIITNDPKKLADLNRDQLSKGSDALDKDMPKYVRESKAPKAPGKIKLFDSGDYTKGINPLFDSVAIDMTSTDRKVAFLDNKYPTALGLAPSSIEVLKKEIIEQEPNLLRKI